MNRKLSKLKAFFIGVVLIKIALTVVCFTGTLPLSAILFKQETAVAQDTPAKEEETVGDGQEETQKEKQYAEVQALMNQLEVKRIQLKDEEERLKQERAQLEQIKRDIDLKMDELAAVQAKIDSSLTQQAEMAAQAQKAQEETEAEELKKLVKAYTTMSPKKAAEIVNKLDMDVVYEVFSNMKGEQVGQILAYVSGDRAAEITERLAADAVE